MDTKESDWLGRGLPYHQGPFCLPPIHLLPAELQEYRLSTAWRQLPKGGGHHLP